MAKEKDKKATDLGDVLAVLLQLNNNLKQLVEIQKIRASYETGKPINIKQ